MDIQKHEADLFTKSEIEGQPELWVDTINSLLDSDNIREFLLPLFQKERLNIILTGAGSSAFIGEAAESAFRIKPGITTRAIPTTTLVTHCRSSIDTTVPLLLISFARSGNSPESIAAVDAVEDCCEETWHIAVTCNDTGRLAQKIEGMNQGLTIVLPSASEDQGLAMTGSFTSMVLSSVYLSKINDGKRADLSGIIRDLSEKAEKVIQSASPQLRDLAQKEFDRIVFLGSGPLQGIARESHLKVQELTDGITVGKYDSFLGFRHGPKAVVTSNTVLVFLFSPDPDVFRYERDLVEEILEEGVAMNCIGVFSSSQQAGEMNLDISISFDLEKDSRNSDFYIVPYVLPAQILGLYKSLNLGLNPDSPSRNNAISRVVKGFTIYH